MAAHRFKPPYYRIVIALGGAACLMSLAYFPVESFTVSYFVLALLTIIVGAHVVIQIPGVSGQITASDTLVFLTLLLFGGEAAVLVAAVDAGITSHRVSRKPSTIFFNAGAMACSTYLTMLVLEIRFGDVPTLTHGGFSSEWMLAVCLLGLLQYGFNSWLVAVAAALNSDQPIWQTWRKYFMWASVTYLAGASAAGLIAKLVVAYGFYAVLVVAPIVAIVYLTYQNYLKNVETMEAQAGQSKRHVEELSHHIAEQERIGSELKASEEQFRTAFDSAAVGMALMQLDGGWFRVNQSFCQIVGYSEEELLTTNFQKATHPDDYSSSVACHNQLLNAKVVNCQLEKRYIHKLGHEVWVSVGAALVRDAQGAPSHIITQIQDISDRKRAESRLIHNALHDALTGLPNRALFHDHLTLAVERAKRRADYKFAVLFLDFDRFKVVNDSLGHMTGDQLLIGIASRLKTCLRPGDTVARLGGDEFTVLLEDIIDVGEAVLVCERLQQSLMQPFILGRHEVFATVSVGIAPSMTGYESAEDILRDADTAMYRAKSLGKARHEIFDHTMHAHALTLLQLETDLRRAIEREEFVVHYQPIINIDTGVVRGFEALVRWNHPERGFVSPADFIPIAEETGLIVHIGRQVLRDACRQMRQWQDEFPNQAALCMSVNLSCKQFAQPDLIEQIEEALREANLNSHCLKLEITESVMMENIETANEMLRRLRALGVELSIDDFGTGYSSLSYLHRFPVNVLKVDRSFVSRMSGHDENVEIVRTIVMLAHGLGMQVVAEGVETNEQWACLKMLGCEYGQGYLFSKPMDASAANEYLSKAFADEQDFSPDVEQMIMVTHGLAA